MKRDEFRKRTRLDVSAEEAYAWHARPGAFERLTPPWEPVRVIRQSKELRDGERVVLSVQVGPVTLPWVSVLQNCQEGLQFQDRQIQGPFAHWVHTHRFEPDGPESCYLEDFIEYTLPLGWPGAIVGKGFVQRKLNRLFSFRHRTVARDLELHALYKSTSRGGSPMKILVTGASGMVGTELIRFLQTGGHKVSRLVRRRARPGRDEIQWDVDAGTIDQAALEGFDAVVHLAGENISEGRWTAEKKARIRDSRVKGTRLLSEALAKLEHPPKVMVSASAIGFYGSRGEEPLSEISPSGSDFLAGVCREWEWATEPAAEKGIRVVNLRFGVILSPKGGALKQMLPPFLMGAGGTLGNGRQYMSWITIDDVVGVIHHAINTESLRGPVNAVAPNPVTNSQFTQTLARVLGRLAFAPVPALALKALFGEMADAILLSSTRVSPTRVLETGYHFQYPELEGGLRRVLGK